MKYILGLFIFIASLQSVEAASPRCENIFAPTAGQIFYQVDQKTVSLRSNSYRSVSNLQEYSWMQRRKIRNILKSIEFEKLNSEQEILIKVQELTTALFVKNETVDGYIFRNKAQRDQVTEQRLLFEGLLREGMLSTWQQQASGAPLGVWSKAKTKAAWLMNSKVFDVLIFPWMLPRWNGPKIPDTLLRKIILEGFDKHSGEVQVLVRAQSKAEAYGLFRKLYAPVVLGTVLIVQAYTAYEMIQQQQEEELQRMLRGIKEQQQQLPNQVKELQSHLYQQAMEQALSDFYQQWGEKPTPEEELRIRQKIAAALNVTLEK